MKQKLSISMDTEIVKLLREKVKQGQFAHLSFAIEYYCRQSLRKGG